MGLFRGLACSNAAAMFTVGLSGNSPGKECLCGNGSLRLRGLACSNAALMSIVGLEALSWISLGVDFSKLGDFCSFVLLLSSGPGLGDTAV